MSPDLLERVLNRCSMIDRGYSSRCYVWRGSLDRDGYAQVNVNGSRHAHRVAYEAVHGRVPDGLEIDHLCRQRDCCNPYHLEAVTHQENVLRGRSPELTRERQAAVTHCPRGHEYTPENTYRKPSGARRCRTCKRLGDRRRVQVNGVRRLVPDPK